MEIVCGKLCYYGEDACRGYTDINAQMASLLFTNVRLGNQIYLAMSERMKLIPLMASLHHPSTVGWVLIACEIVACPLGNSQSFESQSGLYSTIRNHLNTHS